MPNGPSYGRRMSSTSLRAAAGAAAASAALLALPAPSTAETVINTFRVDYEVLVQWEHRQVFGEATTFDGMAYDLKGRLPDVTWKGAVLDTASHAVVKTRKEGSVTANTTNPAATSIACSGGPIQLDGMVAMGPVAGTTKVWFAPWLGARGETQCRDSDGKTGAGALGLTSVGTAKPGSAAAPPGAAIVAPTFGQLDRSSWQIPYHRSFGGKDCPRFTAGHTTKCILDLSGRLTFTRVARKSEADGADDLLGPVEVQKPPKAQPKRGRATTTVECPKACDIEALIGVFGMKNGRPHVSYPARRTTRGKAGRATTVSVPMGSGARTAAKQGLAVMELRVRMGGKTRKGRYPLR